MLRTITPRIAMDLGIWEELCELKQMNKWAVQEMSMAEHDEIHLTEKEAESLLSRVPTRAWAKETSIAS